MLYLVKMTKELSQLFFNGFSYDPNTFSDMSKFTKYTYQENTAASYWEHQQKLGRIHLAVMLYQEPIGDVILKNIDHEKSCCTLSIHLKNDSVKNKGYGTLAELLTLEYAFNVLGITNVFADTIHKNKRSQHVLEKVGFQRIHSDEMFVYYQYSKALWAKCHWLWNSGAIHAAADI